MSKFEIRVAAAESGKITYETGEPCRRGHMAERYVSTGHCVECMRARSLGKVTASASAELPCLPGDVAALSSLAIALASARWPTMVDAMQRQVRHRGGKLRVPCHADDLATLTSYARELWEASRDTLLRDSVRLR